jgi:hypothetical protein
MKLFFRTHVTGWVMSVIVISGCTPSQEQLAARAEKTRTACERQLSDAVTAKSIVELKKAIEKTQSKVSQQQAYPLIQQALERLIVDGQYAIAEEATDYLIATPKFKDLQVLAYATQFKCYSNLKAWPKLQAAVVKSAKNLPDQVVEPLVSQLFSALQRDKQLDVLEKTSQKVYREAPDKPGLVRTATATWVSLCIAKDRQLFPASLDALLADKVSPEQVAYLLDRYFYEMLESKEIMQKICVIGPKILAATQNAATQESVKMRMLDSAFLTDNYDLAVEMLEKGIPGKDKSWHEITLPKVKAHRALAKNKPLEAIQYFKDFMTELNKTKEIEEMDPSTGLIYNRAWVLARNEMRIAKLYASVSDEENRKAAMKRADEHFKIALSKVRPNSKEMTVLTQEIKAAGL